MTVLLSEEDIKTQRITPALQKAGWPLSQIAMEYNLKADRFRIVPDQNKTYKESSRPRRTTCFFTTPTSPLPTRVPGIHSSNTTSRRGNSARFPSSPSRRPPERTTFARQKIDYDNGQVTTTLSTQKTTHVIQACSLCCHCCRRPPHGLCHDQFGRNR